MAKLQVSLEGDASGLTTAMNSGTRSVDRLAVALAKAKVTLQRHQTEVQGVQTQLRLLKLEYDAGNISQDKYKATNIQLRTTLEEARTAVANSKKEVRDLTNEFNTAEKALRANTSTLTRQVYAQRSALSASNNLAKSFTAVATGAGGAAANMGVMARQMALISVMGRGSFVALLRSFYGPAGIAIAVSVAVTAITGLIEKRKEDKRAAEEQDKATKALTDTTMRYVDSLTGVKRVMAQGNMEAQKELTQLKLNAKAVTDANVPLERRREIAQKLIDQYPTTLGGLDAQGVMAGKAAKQFDRLATSITAAAQASAMIGRIADNAAKQLDNRLKIAELENRKSILQRDIDDISLTTSPSSGPGATGISPVDAVATARRAGLLSKRRELEGEISKIRESSFKLSQENLKLEKEYGDIISLTTDEHKDKNKALEKTKDYTNDIAKATWELEQKQLSHWSQRAAAINKQYDDLLKTIKQIGNESERMRLTGLAESARSTDLMRLSADRFISGTAGMREARPGTLDLTKWDIKVPDTLPGAEMHADNLMKTVRAKFESDEFSRSIQRSMVRGIARGLDQLIGNIEDLGSNTEEVFSNVIKSLAQTMQDTFSRSVTAMLGESFSEKFKEGINLGGLSKEVGNAIIGGAMVAGGALQGTQSKTSYGWQGLGGAVQGGAAGFALGGPVGGIIGAVVGGIGGIFGAKSARKAEAQRQQQLEEQRKQTELLKRQNALAYTSNIIGQMTSAGIVTAVDRDAYGQLVAEVSGDQLRFILHRDANKRY